MATAAEQRKAILVAVQTQGLDIAVIKEKVSPLTDTVSANSNNLSAYSQTMSALEKRGR